MVLIITLQGLTKSLLFLYEETQAQGAGAWVKVTQLARGAAEPSCPDLSSGGIVISHPCNFLCSRSWMLRCLAGIGWPACFPWPVCAVAPQGELLLLQRALHPARGPRGLPACSTAPPRIPGSFQGGLDALLDVCSLRDMCPISFRSSHELQRSRV